MTTAPTHFERLGYLAGGYITGISIANSGTCKAVCTDTYGSYIWGPDDTEWRQVINSVAVDPNFAYDWARSNVGGGGGSGIAVAPSAPNKIIVPWNGVFHFSTDYCATRMVRGNLPLKRMYSNTGEQRYWNPRSAISPINSDEAILGTTNDGVYKTTDFGATITAISGITAPADYGGVSSPYLCAYAPDGTAYIQSTGTGLYRLPGGATGTPTLISGSPTHISNLTVGPDGTVWVCDITYSGLRKLVGTTWTSYPIGLTRIPHCIAVDPDDVNHLVFSDIEGNQGQSFDGGATLAFSTYWVGNYVDPNYTYYLSGVDDVYFLSGRFLFPGQAAFNPAATNEVWLSNGLGVAVSNPPSTHIQWQWQSRSLGIQQLVSNDFSLTASGALIVSVWDKGIWRFTDYASVFEEPRWLGPQNFTHAWQTDIAIDDPAYIGSSCGFGYDTSAYSEDGGHTFTEYFPDGWPVPGYPGGSGGAYAVSNRAQQIIVPGYNQSAICTEDDWATWDYLPMDPDPGGPNSNWINAMFTRRLVAADKTRPGTFALVMKSDIPGGQGPGVIGMHVTNNGPLTGPWTRTYAGALGDDPNNFYACTLDYIPGKSGELLYIPGTSQSWNSHLWHFTNDGLGTRTQLGTAYSMEQVEAFGFGKAAEGQSYPAIFFAGHVNSVRGVYVSYDFFATEPLFMVDYPLKSIASVQCISGHPDILGLVFVGYPGAGGDFGVYRDRRLQA